MASHSFQLIGKGTLEFLSIGHGTSYRMTWKLSQHSGPEIDLHWLGWTKSRYTFLYPHHLELLYARFGAANPLGISVAMDYDDMGLAPPNLASNEIDMLFEEGKMFAEVTMHGEDSGLPLLRKYLPEIYDGQILQAMANDPWLDRDLLGDAIRSGHFSTIYEDRWSTHPRWLPEWRSYCGAPTI